MNKYILKRVYEGEKAQYLTTIYRNSTGTSNDIGDALEIENKELALDICKMLNERLYTDYKYSVLEIKTIVSEVKEGEE